MSSVVMFIYWMSFSSVFLVLILNKRQFLKACLSVVLLTVFLLNKTSADDFSLRDIPSEHPNRVAIEYLYQTGVITGKNDGAFFKPNESLNRAEWVALLARLKNISEIKTQNGFCFPDVQDQWYAPYVCFAQEKKWVKGYKNGLFEPLNTVNTAEVLVTLDRVFDQEKPLGASWFSESLKSARRAGVVLTDIPPHAPLTRAQVSELLFRYTVVLQENLRRYEPIVGEALLSRLDEKNIIPSSQNSVDGVNPFNFTLLPDSLPGENSALQKDFSVADVVMRAVSDAPRGRSIIAGAVHIPVLRWQVELKKNIRLDSVSIAQRSAGNLRDIQAARLKINGKKVANNGLFNSEDASIRWQNIYQNYTEGQLLVFEVVLDFDENAQPLSFYEYVVSPQDILVSDKTLQVDGEEVRGESFKIIGGDAAEATIENANGKVNPPFINAENQKVALFRITADDVDIALRSLRLVDDGDLSSRDYRNFTLRAGSTVLSKVDEIDRNIVDFEIDDYIIEARTERTFAVHADIIDGRLFDNIRFYLEEPGDLGLVNLFNDSGVKVINEFDEERARCVGSADNECPPRGLRRYNDDPSRFQIK